MKHIQWSLLFICLCVIFAGCASAPSAKGDTTYSGTVVALRTDSITLNTDSGEITIALTDQTVFAYDGTMDNMGQLPNGGMGGDMGQRPNGGMDLPEGEMSPPDDLPDSEISGTIGQLPEDGTMDPSQMQPQMPDNGAMGGDFEVEMPEITVYNLTLGINVTILTDSKGSASSVTVSMDDLGFPNR